MAILKKKSKLKRKLIAIFKCTLCRKKPFISLRGLNNHIAKAHDVKWRVTLTPQCQGCRRHNIVSRMWDK